MTLRAFFRKAARFEYDEAAIWYESQKPRLRVEFVAAIEHALIRAYRRRGACSSRVGCSVSFAGVWLSGKSLV